MGGVICIRNWVLASLGGFDVGDVTELTLGLNPVMKLNTMESASLGQGLWCGVWVLTGLHRKGKPENCMISTCIS